MQEDTWQSPLYRYGYNGKEKDGELHGEGNSYDYGARIYDPRVGCWWSKDPIADEYANWTPYHFAMNSPIMLLDPDGKDIILAGKNNSSITIKTDLINITLDVAPLGINFGGKYTFEGERILSAALDIAGIIDPTGIADVANAGLQAKNNDWFGAGISLLGVIPYVGDAAKIGKITKDIKIIEEAIDVAKSLTKESVFAERAAESVIKVEKTVAKVEKTVVKEEGIIYKRTNPKTGKEYIGQAKSEKHYIKRKKAHDKKNGVKHKYIVI